MKKLVAFAAVIAAVSFIHLHRFKTRRYYRPFKLKTK